MSGESSRLPLPMLRRAAARAADGILAAWARESEGMGRIWEVATLEALAAAAVAEGDYMTAFELAGGGLALAEGSGWPKVELRVQQALALARTGAVRAAQEAMQAAVSEGDETPRTFGLLARTYRDLGFAARDGGERKSLFAQALTWASRGHSQAPNAYNANQAAQFAWLAGQKEESRRYQEHVLAEWEQLGQAGRAALTEESRFWWHTNLAEMALLRGEIEVAEGEYALMRALGAGRMANVGANAKVCRLLLEAAGRAPAELEAVFRLPAIVVAAGHMFDGRERTVPRFPLAQETVVAEAVVRQLERWDAGGGFVSSSAGADLLIAEALVSRRAVLQVVLPLARSLMELVSHRQPLAELGLTGEEVEERLDRHRRVLAAARRVKEPAWARPEQIEPGAVPTPPSRDLTMDFAHANRLLLGLARLSAETHGWPLRALAVWDRAPDAVPGSTAEFVVLCREQLGIEPVVIDPAAPDLPAEDAPSRLREGGQASGVGAAAPGPLSVSPTTGTRREIATFLFADLKGFSGLPEEGLAEFMGRFFAGAAVILNEQPGPARLTNTWGDALHAVYKEPLAAAYAARRLQAWAAGGFRADGRPGLGVGDSGGPPFLRIGLHTGPVAVGHDAVLGKESFIGPHLVLGARLEPIAEAGQILVTEDFAALARAEGGDSRLAFSYQGLATLPKGFGRVGVYRMD